MTIEAIIPLVIMGGAFLLIAIVAHTSGQGNLDHIKSKTVGDGQHGTARWATSLFVPRRGGKERTFLPFKDWCLGV